MKRGVKAKPQPNVSASRVKATLTNQTGIIHEKGIVALSRKLTRALRAASLCDRSILQREAVAREIAGIIQVFYEDIEQSGDECLLTEIAGIIGVNYEGQSKDNIEAPKNKTLGVAHGNCGNERE